MKKKIKKTAKPDVKPEVKKADANTFDVHLGNIFPYVVSVLSTINRQVDRLQKTMDAVGLAVANLPQNQEKK